MLIQSLHSEFEHEAASTRKLLQAVPAKDTRYKPSPISWTMGELAQHIATIYYWYEGTLTKDVYDIAADRLERGDPNDIQATLALFERNLESARAALHGTTDESLQRLWTMKTGEHIVLGPYHEGLCHAAFCSTIFITTGASWWFTCVQRATRCQECTDQHMKKVLTGV